MTLRDHAHRILASALAAVDPRVAVRRAMRLEGETLHVAAERVDLAEVDHIMLVGAGKAAPAMAAGALDVLADRVSGGTITTKYGHALPLPGIQTFEAGHPVPDERGQAGAQAALTLAESAGERDLLLCLLSGGASALWPAPVEGVSLPDLREVTDSLLRAGATIGELNAVRKHLSRVSGGHLARVAAPGRVVSLLVSDVVGSPLDVIASGPTVPDSSAYRDAVAVLRRFGVVPPAGVRAHLEAGLVGDRPETPKTGDAAFLRTTVHIIASNRDALEGAARGAGRLGYTPLILTTRLEGEAREVARVVGGLALGLRYERLPLSPPAALLLGGETTVTVRGNGRGGRNQEGALAAALAIQGETGIVIACLGTDGSDGPTDAAGGIVDGETIARGSNRSLDAHEHLARNDAYSFLHTTGDLLITGPTGTNVNDVTLVLVATSDRS